MDERGKIFEGRVIPKKIIINSYFNKEQKVIEILESESEEYISQLEEIEEEHGGEDGLLEEVMNEKGKIKRNNVIERIRELVKAKPLEYTLIAADASVGVKEEDEESILRKYLEILDKEIWVNKKIKETRSELEKKILEKYKVLTEEEVKVLVVDDKWMSVIYNDVQSELQRISQRLSQRIKELAERYESPLPQLNDEIKLLEKKVNSHLSKMGFEWN
jgi:type I restriction enzyme M protein